MYLIRRVDRDEHRAKLGGSPEGDIPRGEIGCPYGDLRACLYAERNERSCKAVNVLAELRVGAGVVESRVLEGGPLYYQNRARLPLHRL